MRDSTLPSATTQSSDFTGGEFRQLMRELMDEMVFRIEQPLPDPDEGKALTPAFAENLRESIAG